MTLEEVDVKEHVELDDEKDGADGGGDMVVELHDFSRSLNGMPKLGGCC